MCLFQIFQFVGEVGSQIGHFIFEAVQRMAGDIDSQNFFFARQFLLHSPIGQFGERILAFLFGFHHAEKPCCPISRSRELRVPDSIARSSASVSCARLAPVESSAPAFTKAFNHAAIHIAQVDAVAEFIDGRERAAFFARFDNGFHRALSYILHSA